MRVHQDHPLKQAKHIKFAGIKERSPSRIDGREFEYTFEIGTLNNGVFVREQCYVLDIQTSGTLEAIWRVSNVQLMQIAASFASTYVLELASEDRLAELSTFKLHTYNAPQSPPKELRLEPGTVQAVPATHATPDPASYSFLSENISEVRDQVNALAKSLWGDRILLLSQERPLFDMYKDAKSTEDFSARIQSLGIIVKDLNRTTLAKATAEKYPKDIPDFILLERALQSIANESEVSAICTTFKQINYLRQGYPTHGDNADKLLMAHQHFQLPYPIVDFSAAWETILGHYFNAMKRILSVMSAAWTDRSPSK
jgi:hypothetical protein